MEYFEQQKNIFVCVTRIIKGGIFVDYNKIYDDITKRTGSELYIGVVGPVRTGKSAFIKRFSELYILPGIDENYSKERLLDELPQSGAGRMIMTSQMKFVPEKAVRINLCDKINVKVRLIDCVGYPIEGVSGRTENGMPRMVRTPWFDKEISFDEAAQIGTKKVIENHSTIGIVMTSDGTISDIPRENYIEAEERAVKELKAIGKPFAVVINSKTPMSNQAYQLRDELEMKYNAPVHTIDVLNMDENDISSVFSDILYEFPVKTYKFNIPEWIFTLEKEHWLFKEMVSIASASADSIARIKDVNTFSEGTIENNYLDFFRVTSVDMGEGAIHAEIKTKPEVLYKILSERCGCEVNNDYELFSVLKDYSAIKTDYERILPALKSARSGGYGAIQPIQTEMTLDEPELIKQGNRFGVKFQASAPSLHILRADIKTIVSPIIGAEKQCEELLDKMVDEFATDPSKLWQTDIFGKSLYELVNEGLSNKLSVMPDDVSFKMQEAFQRIINEGSDGVVCIIL